MGAGAERQPSESWQPGLLLQPRSGREGPGFSWGAQCSQFLSAMCFGSKVGRGSLCFWCLGTWATLGIGLSHSRVTQPPPPQPAVRRGTRRATPVRSPQMRPRPPRRAEDRQEASWRASVGEEGESGAHGAASHSTQAGRSGGRRQQIPLQRRAMRSSGN